MLGEHGNESDTTLYEVSSCTTTACVVAAILSDDISSVRCSIIPSISRGNLDKLSASLFSRPGRYESANRYPPTAGGIAFRTGQYICEMVIIAKDCECRCVVYVVSKFLCY